MGGRLPAVRFTEGVPLEVRVAGLGAATVAGLIFGAAVREGKAALAFGTGGRRASVDWKEKEPVRVQCLGGGVSDWIRQMETENAYGPKQHMANGACSVL